MALFDAELQQVVVRIVYDGPARSGKTTSLRQLGALLGRGTFSADEAEGRTLYFDWLDYTGGRFRGSPIRCQVVSVPGQKSLRARRVRLIQEADAAVFVADTRSGNLEASEAALHDLRLTLTAAGEPLPGIVVQANRRDAPDASPMAEVRERLGCGGDHAVTETVATRGEGLRETFVLAVRLALDRVGDLQRRARLDAGRPFEGPEALLAALRAAEHHDADAAEAFLGLARGAGEPAAGSAAGRRESPGHPDAPWLPSTSVPGGLIWPAVGGRVVLSESLAEPVQLDALGGGSWAGTSGRWRLHANGGHDFAGLEQARGALIDWARFLGAIPRLSPHRCLVAAEAAGERWRLWQVVRTERTLREVLEQALDREPVAAARELFEVAIALVEAAPDLERLGVACTLDAIGLAEPGLVYAGLAPAEPDGPREPRTPEEVLLQELEPVLAARPAALDVPRVLHHLLPLARGRAHQRIGEILAASLIGL